MSESQTDYDLQRMCFLEARMRNSERFESFNASYPPKKIEPLHLIMVETRPSKPEFEEIQEIQFKIEETEKKENHDSIDLKTNQKLKEISLQIDNEEKQQQIIPERTGKNHNLLSNEKGKIGTENRRYVKRRLDLDYDPMKKPKQKNLFDEKNPNGVSDNSNEGLNFHNNNLTNNTKITDYFEMKLNRKMETHDKKIDFKSIKTNKHLHKSQQNLLVLQLKKIQPETKENSTNNESIIIKKENSNNDSSQVPEFISENLRLKEEIRKLNKKILDKDGQINEGQTHFNELIQENKGLQENVKYCEEHITKYSMKTKDVLCKILLDHEKIKRRELKNHLFSQRERLGEYVSQRQGHKFVDIWVDGYDLRNTKEKLLKVRNEREELEKKKKNFKNKKITTIPSLNNVQAAKNLFSSNLSTHFSDSENNFETNSNSEITPSEYKNRISFQIAMLQREELSFNEELKRLDMEKIAYIQQFKRQYEEENCRFAKPDLDNSLPTWPLLNKKYQTLSLLGKGGFSEVYKAFDLNNYREVACKIHQLNPLWSELNKTQYIKHAFRETQTHKTLNHPNIVKLFETFELDQNTLCTILEYCNGTDLSIYLKQAKLLQEKDAKMIMKQILYGLKYLHENQRKIIHYDLKPQNILFHLGEIKITDFGLCKVMDVNTSLLELTSQGVGTYWYLPPECFEIGENPPKITTKVDIWSVGVILFEMVFGEKPFGNNMSQEKILKEQVILSVDGVKFPSKPIVSNECKEFIANCLIRSPEKRWDVNQCLNSTYLNKK